VGSRYPGLGRQHTFYGETRFMACRKSFDPQNTQKWVAGCHIECRYLDLGRVGQRYLDLLFARLLRTSFFRVLIIPVDSRGDPLFGDWSPPVEAGLDSNTIGHSRWVRINNSPVQYTHQPQTVPVGQRFANKPSLAPHRPETQKDKERNTHT
jgi:hypothetical protein